MLRDLWQLSLLVPMETIEPDWRGREERSGKRAEKLQPWWEEVVGVFISHKEAEQSLGGGAGEVSPRKRFIGFSPGSLN